MQRSVAFRDGPEKSTSMELYTEETLQRIEELCAAEDRETLATLLRQYHPADLADCLERLDPDAAHFAIRSVTHEEAADILREMEEETRLEIVGAVEPHILSDIVEEMEADDAADFLDDMEDAQAEDVLRHMEDEDRRSVAPLLEYEEDTAGGLMRPDFLSFHAGRTTGEVITELRKTEGDALEQRLTPRRVELDHDYISYIYVVDEAGRLQGTVSLYRLLTVSPDTTLGELASTPPAVVRVDMDQEEVARIVEHYDLLAVPVVDAGDIMVGRITLDDVIDVIHEEATEDMFLMAGSSSDYDPILGSPWSGIRARLPWMLLALGCGLGSGIVLASWHGALESLPALVFFIPVVTAMGGNTSLQSSTLVIRGLAMGRIAWRDVMRLVFKELTVGFLIGLACGLLMALIAPLLFDITSRIGFTIALAMFVLLSISALFGCLMPLLLDRVGFDPAVAAGPFITTFNDIVGLIIYFSVCTAFLAEL